ncbi:hypothetical protein NDU88_002413 [Pleurodeles waltl]|uniref:Uncharacterized protein n=1 Tax=Pleurodeles waltl TaxID=8319 RepID=A0AAV7UW44_PLEWA|nr:hypothetical protein NDU88_002413 [Pleurodeles waltl]
MHMWPLSGRGRAWKDNENAKSESRFRQAAPATLCSAPCRARALFRADTMLGIQPQSACGPVERSRPRHPAWRQEEPLVDEGRSPAGDVEERAVQKARGACGFSAGALQQTPSRKDPDGGIPGPVPGVRGRCLTARCGWRRVRFESCPIREGFSGLSGAHGASPSDGPVGRGARTRTECPWGVGLEGETRRARGSGNQADPVGHWRKGGHSATPQKQQRRLLASGRPGGWHLSPGLEPGSGGSGWEAPGAAVSSCWGRPVEDDWGFPTPLGLGGQNKAAEVGDNGATCLGAAGGAETFA